MKTLLLTIVLALASMHQLVAGQCSSMRVRKEWRQLSSSEQQLWLSALRTLHEQGRYDKYAQRHSDNFDAWHGSGYFLSAHRRLVYDLETEIRSLGGQYANVAMPYWNWAMDSANPGRSAIWRTFQRGSPDQCMTEIGSKPFEGGDSSCIRRRMGTERPRAHQFVDSALLGQMKAETDDIEDWQSAIEVGAHFQVHNEIGGTMISPFSSRDPLFWLHHSFIDYLFDSWQRYSPGRFNQVAGIKAKGSSERISRSDVIPGFSVRVREVLDISEMCVAYQGENPPPPPPPRPAPTGNIRPRSSSSASSSSTSTTYSKSAAKASSTSSTYTAEPSSTSKYVIPTPTQTEVPKCQLPLMPRPQPLPDDFIAHMNLDKDQVQKIFQKHIMGSYDSSRTCIANAEPVHIVGHIEPYLVIPTDDSPVDDLANYIKSSNSATALTSTITLLFTAIFLIL